MTTVFPHVGKAWGVAKWTGTETSVANRVAWGSGTGVSESGTALISEHTEARAVATITQETTTVTGDTYQAVATLVANADKNVSEGGLLDAASGGNLIIHGDFPTIPMLTGDSILFTETAQLVQASA